MSTTFSVRVILESGREALFEPIAYGRACDRTLEGIRLRVGAEHPAPVTVTPPGADDPVRSVEYRMSTELRNFHRPIIPDSGRWYVFNLQMVNLWRHATDSSVNDIKTPLFIFTGQDQHTALAFGVLGRNYETAFNILEPRHNRALITYMRRLTLQIKRGTDLYPIPESVRREQADGSVTEWLYFRTASDAPNRPWMLTLRDYATELRARYGLEDRSTEAAMAPLWCSWTDWMSDDVTDAVVLDNVREGLKLGIRNYIIDDGWFGPGLDNEYDVELNIGDWEPEPSRFPDLKGLVRDIRNLGAAPMIWCAPHAVARGARCFEQRRPYLIVDGDGRLVTTPNVFHSLCFMCPEARRIMADIAAGLIENWDVDGVKYDLFNCVPNVRCENPDHRHDVSSMVEGLERTLEAMDERTRALKPGYIVELKQNYGTPFLTRYGSMTRAGDTPYSPEANYLRTAHVQGYTPFSINDYQTVTNADAPEDAACVVIKMLAAGIPTYSIDFRRLGEANKAVIAHYNRWYNERIAAFMHHRLPLDGECNRWRVEAPEEDYVFLVNQGGKVPVRRSTTVLNGTYERDLVLVTDTPVQAEITLLDARGTVAARQQTSLSGRQVIDALPGGMVLIKRVDGT